MKPRSFIPPPTDIVEATVYSEVEDPHSSSDLQDHYADEVPVIKGGSADSYEGHSSSESSEDSRNPLIHDSNGHTQDGSMRESYYHAHRTQKNAAPSNERLLGVAFMSFLCFGLLQFVCAYTAGSQAMIGDSLAMLVDCFTYLCNFFAERRKNHFEIMFPDLTHEAADPELATKIRERARRKVILQLEIYPPLVSVLTLIVVVFIVFKKAVKLLILDTHRMRSEQDIPNLDLMLGFSVFNLGLDMLNVFCFAKAKHLCGFQTTEDRDDKGSHCTSPNSGPTSTYTHVEIEGDLELCERNKTTIHEDDAVWNEQHSNVTHDKNGRSDSDDDVHHANLNMCSAYTHVFADTLRSLSVILAAGTAEAIPTISPEVADSTAAVVVSVVILLSLLPLFRGLYLSISELHCILLEERAEAIFYNRNEDA